MTRYEIIKNLSVEDMAEWLLKGVYCIHSFGDYTDCKLGNGEQSEEACLLCIRQYLTEEVESVK